MARQMLYHLHNKNKKQCQTNKNKIYRLQHNKNNSAGPQLTDYFGED